MVLLLMPFQFDNHTCCATLFSVRPITREWETLLDKIPNLQPMCYVQVCNFLIHRSTSVSLFYDLGARNNFIAGQGERPPNGVAPKFSVHRLTNEKNASVGGTVNAAGRSSREIDDTQQFHS